MRELLARLNRREQVVLCAGLTLLLALLLHLGLVRPLRSQLAAYEHEIPAQRELLSWMEASAREVQRLQAARVTRAKGGTVDSPLTVIDQLAKEQQLDKRIKRLEPAAEGEVRIWLEEAEFAALVSWLALLEERVGLTVSDLSVERAKGEGLINATITVAPAARP